MQQSIRLGQVAGIPVGMHWTVAVIAALVTDMLAVSVLPSVIAHQPAGLYWAAAAAGSALFVAALAAHEIAHAIVARRRGVMVRSITLWMLGGITELEEDPPTAAADLHIAIAGPATSLAAGIVFGAAAVLARSLDGPAVFTGVLAWLSLMNMTLAVFNLLPGAPLDGGRILRGLLWKRHGDRQRASRAAARSGQILGTGIAAIGVLELLAWRDIAGGLWLMLIGWFLVTAAHAEQQSETVRAALAGLRVRDVMLPDPDIGSAWSSAADFTVRVVISSPQSVFPVVSMNGGLIGVVFAEALARVPPASRATTRLGQVLTPLSPAYICRPDALASSLLGRAPLRGQVLAVVVDDGQVIGLVTTAELRLAMLRAGCDPARRPGPAGEPARPAGASSQHGRDHRAERPGSTVVRPLGRDGGTA
jgi:Zn-dependent protease/CBS domain-containing protein